MRMILDRRDDNLSISSMSIHAVPRHEFMALAEMFKDDVIHTFDADGTRYILFSILEMEITVFEVDEEEQHE